MKRIAITGATGFIGANLARQLLQDGHQIHLLVRPGYTPWRIQAFRDEVRLYEVELHDAEALGRVINKIRPEWVFHLAAHGAYSWQTDLPRMVQTNILGTINLVEACLKIGFDVFINAGSSSEYGFKDHAPSEDEWIEPNSSYAVTKAAGTHYCRFVAQSKNVNLATVRLYSVYGPFEEPARLIPSLIIEGLQGRLPPLVNPDIARDYVFVDDISEAFLTLASNPTGISAKVYNLGAGVQLSLRSVVDIACQELPIVTKPLWGSMPDRSWDTSIWKANINNITTETGWEPRYTFREGFRQTINWFNTNPDFMIHYFRR